MERCKQISRGFEQQATAIQIFSTPVLCFDSELALHTETNLTRLDRKVHAILFKTTRWRFQTLTFTLLARGHQIHPSLAVNILGNQTYEKEYCVKEPICKEEQRAEEMGPVSVVLHHMKALGWTLLDRLVSREDTEQRCTSRRERINCSTTGSERSDLVQGRSSEKQRRPTVNCRNQY